MTDTDLLKTAQAWIAAEPDETCEENSRRWLKLLTPGINLPAKTSPRDSVVGSSLVRQAFALRWPQSYANESASRPPGRCRPWTVAAR